MRTIKGKTTWISPLSTVRAQLIGKADYNQLGGTQEFWASQARAAPKLPSGCSQAGVGGQAQRSQLSGGPLLAVA